MLQDDFPFQGACVSAQFPPHNVAMKGLAIRVSTNANMLFDTDLLRMAAGWTGGYIDTHGVAFDGGHGAHPKIVGDQKFGCRVGPGWADSQGIFADPRPEPFGPLDAAWCRWDGLYVNGSNVVLAYTVHGTKFFEQPGVMESDGQTIFTRTFQVEKTKSNMTLLVCDVDGATGSVKEGIATLSAQTNVTRVTLSGAPAAVKLEITDKSRPNRLAISSCFIQILPSVKRI